MRYRRRANMDLEECPEPELRIEIIRELVDELPPTQNEAISLMFFGAGRPTIRSVAREMGLSEYKLREALSDGFDAIRQALQEEDRLGALLSDDDPRVRALFGASALEER